MNDPFLIGLDSHDPGKVVLGTAFTTSVVPLRDASIQYVSGGSGPAIIFLHGFSQDWYEFGQVMRLLADRYTVLAVDLRGIGKSKATRADYDAETLANDIHELAGQLAMNDRLYVCPPIPYRNTGYCYIGWPIARYAQHRPHGQAAVPLALHLSPHP